MKRLFTLASALLVGCTTIKKIDTTGFHSVDNTILYEKDTVATLAAQPIANYLTFGISGTYLTINTTGGAGTMAYNALVIPAY